MAEKDINRLHTVKPQNPDDPQGIREYYQRIIDAMPNNVYWLDRNCITLGCNKNTLRLIGLDKIEQFVGIDYKTMGELANWTEGQAESFRRDDMDVIESGKAKYHVEEPPLYDDEGNPVYYMSSRVPLFDEHNQVIGVVGISVDITQRKQLEERLRQTEVSEARFKAMASLGGMVAHELRTPLTSLGLASVAIKEMLPQLIEGYERSNPEEWGGTLKKHRLSVLKKSIDNMETSIKYAQMTIDTILKNFHDNEDDLVGEPSTFSLKKAVDAAMDDYPFDAEERALCKVKRLDNITVRGVDTVLIQVIHNVLKNALHVINAEGKGDVTLYTRVEGDVVYLVIEDTAKGISDEELPHIFEPFYTTKKDTSVSIGMGLYFSKTAMEKMGGSITCESTPGLLTRFTLALPKV